MGNNFRPLNKRYPPWRGHTKPVNPILDLSHPLSRNLVAYWPLGIGTKHADDVSQYQNLGTLTNMATAPWTDSHHGGLAYAFDGMDDYVSIPSNDLLNVNATGTMSIVMWANLHAKISTFARMINKWSGSKGWAFDAANNAGNSYLDFYIDDGAGHTSNTRLSDAELTLDVWYQVAATLPARGTAVKLYRNGAEAASYSAQESTAAIGDTSNTNIAAIGALSSDFSHPFNGKIEGVRVYQNRVLSAQDVAWLYAEPYAGLLPKVRAYGVGATAVTDSVPPLWRQIQGGMTSYGMGAGR